MKNEFEFQVTENSLENTSGIFSSLTAVNAYYKAVIFYMDDYISDLKNKSLLAKNLTVDIKPVHTMVNLKYYPGTIYIDLNFCKEFDARNAEKIKAEIDKAKASADALQQLLDKFFPALIPMESEQTHS